MTEKLPSRLDKEPLLDALFEVRFTAAAPVSSVMPGVLFAALQGNKAIEALPASQIPSQIRESDPNLRFAPVMRIKLDQYIVQFSDHSFAVSCRLPYPGWSEFRPFIIYVMGVLSNVGIVTAVQRYSLKYIDIIEVQDPQQQISYANVSLRVANHQLSNEPCHIRMDVKVNGFTNIITMASSATATNDQGVAKQGLVIDIDTIMDLNGMPFAELCADLEPRLRAIHAVNKKTFFDCLTPSGLAFLEPIYD